MRQFQIWKCVVYFMYRVFWKYCVLLSLPRQHWAAIGRPENGQPIGKTAYTYIALRILKNSCSNTHIAKGRVAVDCEKNTFFPEHPVSSTLTSSHHRS